MPIQPWQNIIEAVRNGEPVTAEVANRAIFQLAQRTDHLKTRQDAQDYAQALFVSGVPLADDVLTGNAVYFDADVMKFAKAYAAFEYDGGYLRPSKSSNVVGFVVSKDTADSGTLVIDGLIDPVKYTGDDCLGQDMTVNMLLDSSERGVMYLASGPGNAGKVTSRPGLVNMPVCNLIDYVPAQGGHLVVRPPVAGALESQALRFQLAPRPAAPEALLKCVVNDVDALFASTPFSVGTRVQVYISPAASPNTVTTVLMDATVHRLTNDSAPGAVGLIDVQMTSGLVSRLANRQTYADVFKADANQAIAIKVLGTNTGILLNRGTDSGTDAATTSSYVPLVGATGSHRSLVNSAVGLANLLDATLPGWLPANPTYFPGVAIPPGARYGYNFAADPVLHQLFPEGVVSAYILHKDGVALSSGTATVDSNGIWWFDGLNQLPWNGVSGQDVLPNTQINYSDFEMTTSDDVVEPADLSLCYAKLVSGGVAVVTTLESDSPALQITDPDGNPATSGPLILKTGFDVQEGTSEQAGSLVVKDVTGFVMKRGHVVERIVAGDNILVQSTVSGGRGSVTVSVQGLDGKLEGSPDVLAVDDVLIERDPNEAIFYSSMPPLRNSSILAKVDVPGYLVAGATYTLHLDFVFVALHSAGNSTMPNLNLSWTLVSNPPGSLSNVTRGYLDAGLALGNTQAPRTYFAKTTATLTSLTAGGTVFFSLARASTDSYSGKLGIVSMRYRFTRN